ncbi:MAG TPA: hypothetical protein QF433_06600 [Candidatus Thalassarchaeaceae archaeon]|nr:hypothetical protein [Candidatus Thalassarchaeaceae archaeon]
MARKKPKPFNPFAPNASSKKSTKQSTGSRKEIKPVNYRAQEPSKPSQIERTIDKPAIPTSHLPPSETPTVNHSEPEPEETTAQQIEEEPTKVEESIPQSGPAIASDKVRRVGLRKVEDKSSEEIVTVSDDDRITDLIAESKALAVDSGLVVEGQTDEKAVTTDQSKTTEQEIKEVKKTVSEKAFERRKQMMGKKRKARASAPPTKRVQKLNRRKYMEFKVDVREILDEEDVLEEYRANILGSTWAKGERQGIQDAIEFIEEKLDEGIITDAVSERIINVLKGYRKVR